MKVPKTYTTATGGEHIAVIVNRFERRINELEAENTRLQAENATLHQTIAMIYETYELKTNNIGEVARLEAYKNLSNKLDTMFEWLYGADFNEPFPIDFLPAKAKQYIDAALEAFGKVKHGE